MRNNQVYAQLLLHLWLEDPIRATTLRSTRNNAPCAQTAIRIESMNRGPICSASCGNRLARLILGQATERTRLTRYPSARFVQVIDFIDLTWLAHHTGRFPQLAHPCSVMRGLSWRP